MVKVGNTVVVTNGKHKGEFVTVLKMMNGTVKVLSLAGPIVLDIGDLKWK